MRLVSAHGGGGSVAELCYKFGLEEGNTTVLGVVAFEGLQVLCIIICKKLVTLRSTEQYASCLRLTT